MLVHDRFEDYRDVFGGLIYMGQLRDWPLPVAAASFTGQLTRVLQARYE
jgi:hypothetical protein